MARTRRSGEGSSRKTRYGRGCTHTLVCHCHITLDLASPQCQNGARQGFAGPWIKGGRVKKSHDKWDDKGGGVRPMNGVWAQRRSGTLVTGQQRGARVREDEEGANLSLGGASTRVRVGRVLSFPRKRK